MEKNINGINVDRLGNIIQDLRNDSELGRYQFRTSAKWEDGARWQTTVKGFYGFKKEDDTRKQEFVSRIDEPESLLGTNQGPNPTESLLNALATCIGTTFIYHSAAQGVKISSMKVRLEGDIDLRGFTAVSDQVRPGFQEIRYFYDVKSDASDDKIRELFELATRLSPVSDTVRNSVPVIVMREGTSERRSVA